MPVERAGLLVQKALSSRLSRRELIKAAALAAGGAFLAACGTEPESTATVPPAETKPISPTLAPPTPTETAAPTATATAAPSPEPTPTPEPNWAEPGLPPEFREELAKEFRKRLPRVAAAYLTGQGAGDHLRVRVKTFDLEEKKYLEATVSEGMAYYLLLTKNQDIFDDLFSYVEKYSDVKGLMTWFVAQDGEVPEAQRGASTDAELDIALALILADRKWSGDYLEKAKARLALIEEHLVRSDFTLLPGDEWGDENTRYNPSFVSPYHFEIFAKYSDRPGFWENVAARQREIEKGLLVESPTGLMPNWAIVDEQGARPDPTKPYNLESSWDAVRVPWRHAMMVLWGEDPASEAYRHSVRVLQAWSGFFENIPPEKVWPGYDVITGEPITTEYTDPIFTDAAALALIVGPAEVKRRYWEYLLATPATQRYFQESFRLLTLWVGGGVYLV